MAYPISIDLGETGLTLTARLISGGASVQSIALAESGTVPGHYSGSGTGAAAGKYGVRVEDSAGTLKGTGEIEIDGDAEVTAARPKIVILQKQV